LQKTSGESHEACCSRTNNYLINRPHQIPQVGDRGALAATVPDLSPDQRAAVLALFEVHVDAGLSWVRRSGREQLPSVDNNLVASLAAMVQVGVGLMMEGCLCLLRCEDAYHQPAGGTPTHPPPPYPTR